MRIEAEGNPLTLTEGDGLHASAKHLEYLVREQRITLREDAHITHMERSFTGARIDYDLASRQVEASGDGAQRVRLVIPGTTLPGRGEGDSQ